MADIDILDKTMHIDQMPAAEPLGIERTLRPEGPANETEKSTGDKHRFVLNGDVYEEKEVLSMNTGEAQVFLVTREEKDYVLKVYYPNFEVNNKLLQVIHSLHFEMIVELYEYGKTYVDGKNRTYELMEYLHGSTLGNCKLNGDINRFRRIALQAAAALAYCHQNGVLHKDIKPTNYFFRDAEQEQLVLGDFGISALRDNDALTFHTTQARTPIYAAPEMYADVIDGMVELTPAADYYSLGITLFTLWLGENPMSSHEREMMRQKNEGRLPRLNELPDRVRQIVQGLTSVNQQTRWGYNEVERWFKGEDVPVDTSSPALHYKGFVVDPEKNLVADNVKELVKLLSEREQLGMNYLYSGRIVQWLEQSGNTKLVDLVKDIITNQYPVDKHSGFVCALYTMAPEFPYHDVHGAACEDVHSIAVSLLSNVEHYGLQLQDRNDSMFLWLKIHTKCDVDRLRSYFRKDADPRIAVLKMVYEIDPDIPFLLNNPSSTITEISDSFGHAAMGDDEWRSLCDGRLLSWMHSHGDLIACESLRILTQDQPYSQSLAYKVLYNMDRDAGYDLRNARTPEDIGNLLSVQLQQAQHLSVDEFTTIMGEYTNPEGRFQYFAQLHGWYDILNEAKSCFDLELAENRERLSAYDIRTALYRFCRILGAKPQYLLPNGTVLNDGRNIDLSYTSLLRSELRNGSLSQWMSVYFHEDPTHDFSEEYSYERELHAWINALGDIDKQQPYFKRFTKACEDTKSRVDEVREQWKRAQSREKIWKYTFYGACGLWILMLIIFGISGRDYVLDNSFLTINLPLGGMLGVIVAVRAYFRGYGSALSILTGLLGFIVSFIPVYLLTQVHQHATSMFNIVVIAITVVLMLVCHYTRYKSDNVADSTMVKDLLKSEDIKSTLLEPLYYTFKTKSQRYKGTKFSLLDEVSDQVHSLAGESVIHYVLWSVLALVYVVIFILYSPKMADMPLPGTDNTDNESEYVIDDELENEGDADYDM